MTLLEDRLTRILELRIAGKTEEDISKETGLETKIINEYEESLKKSLSYYGKLNADKIVLSMGISPVLVNMAISFYGFPPRKRLSLVKRNVPSVSKVKKPVSETIEEIRKLASEGLNEDEIASRLGYSPKTIIVYAYRGHITELTGLRKYTYSIKKRQNIERLKKFISEGIISNKELHEKSGLSYGTIYMYRIDGLLGLPKATRGRKTITGEPAKELVQRTIDEGVKSIEEICVRTGLSLQTVRRFCGSKNIELTVYSEDGLKTDITNPALNLASSKRRQNIDELVGQGLTLKQIGEKIGVCKERIRQYIFETGQHSEYRKLRRAKKAETGAKRKLELLQDIRILITKRLEQAAEKEGWAYEKAVEYLNSYKHPHRIATSFENIIEFFRRYETAVKSGNKLSVGELSDGIFKWPGDASRILSKVGLEPMIYGDTDRHHSTPKEKKEAIRRSLHLKMSSRDVAYFLKVPYAVAQQSQKRYGGRKHRFEFLRGYRIGIEGERALSYRLASQIYEARDLGFDICEIVELLDMSLNVVNYALSHRRGIQQKITKELKVLYRGRKGYDPYVTKQDRLD